MLCIKCTHNFEVDLTPVDALAPIYRQIEVGDNVSEVPRAFGIIEQIEYYDSYILIAEKETGIHIVDNTNPDDPATVAFLGLPGITDFLIQDGFLVVSLANHVISVALTDVQNSTITAIVYQPSPNGNGLYPNIDFDGRFECVDLSKGIVINWELKKVVNPECQTIN